MRKLSLQGLKDYLAKYMFNSVKSLIVWLFIPIIALIVITTGIFSYVLARQQLEEHAYINIADTLTQTKSYLDNRLTDVMEQLVGFTEDNNTLSVMSRASNDQRWRLRDFDYVRLAENLNKIYISYYSILHSVLFYLNDGRVLMYKTDNLYYGLNFSFPEWRRRFRGNPSEFYWLNLHKNRVFKGDNDDVASLFNLIGNQATAARGIVLFNLRASFFRKILENPVISRNGYLALVSKDGAMVFKTVDRRYRLDGALLARIRRLPDEAGNFRYQRPFGPKMVVVYQTINACRWKLAALVPENEILDKANYIKNLTLLLIVSSLVVAVVMSNVLALIITKPLSRLTRKVKAVKEGDMDVPFDVATANEIGILNNGIGELIVRIKSLLNRVQEEQEKKRIADLTILQAQINPHFLYNTLYSIQQLCALGESQNASKMLLALANFFRIGLNRGREIISIGEEIDHVRNYLVIQHMKYADQFRFEIVMEPDILEAPIIKLTLQPLIENAIYHGVKPKPGDGVIGIRGYRDGTAIRIEVRDNGAGMTEDQLAELRQSLAARPDPRQASGYGLWNVHERLKIHFGPAYGLTIASREGQGTLVTVTIPAPAQAAPLTGTDQ